MFKITIILFCLSIGAQAANQHEHYTGFLDTDGFMRAYAEVFGQSIGETTLGFAGSKRGKDRSPQALTALFGPDAIHRVVTASKYRGSDVGSWIATLSLNEISRYLGQSYGVSSQSILLQFFENGSQSPMDIPNYKFHEDFRKVYFKNLVNDHPAKYRKLLIRSFEHTLDAIPLRDRTTVSLSIPGKLFDKESIQQLQKVFHDRGSQLEINYSYPRYKILESEDVFTEKLALIQTAIREGWAHGVDITGSIEETVSPGSPKETAANYLSRVTRISEVVGEKGLLKVHAFEKTRSGTFYDALWKHLDNMASGKFPKTGMVVVAHIAQLQEEDILRFESLRDRGLLIGFDANLKSNVFLQDSKLESLIKTMERLTIAGFSVGLGGDGSGIFGRYDISAIFDTIEKHLPKHRARALQVALLRGSLPMRNEAIQYGGSTQICLGQFSLLSPF